MVYTEVRCLKDYLLGIAESDTHTRPFEYGFLAKKFRDVGIDIGFILYNSHSEEFILESNLDPRLFRNLVKDFGLVDRISVDKEDDTGLRSIMYFSDVDVFDFCDLIEKGMAIMDRFEKNVRTDLN